ncbi:hypothetical protein [Deinococcus sp.]|uniref:hypothetical protein n=1 Tax=Deinococcus sp. TaxID=47478 RepID=UPI003CC5565B
MTGDRFTFGAAGNAFVTPTSSARLLGSRDAAFGVVNDRSSLYVVQDGGAFLSLIPPDFARAFPQDRAAPAVLRLDLKT